MALTRQQIEEIVDERLQLRDSDYHAWVVEARKKIDEGVKQLARGEGLDGEKVMEELMSSLEKGDE